MNIVPIVKSGCKGFLLGSRNPSTSKRSVCSYQKLPPAATDRWLASASEIVNVTAIFSGVVMFSFLYPARHSLILALLLSQRSGPSQ